MFLFIFILEAPISQRRVRPAAYVTCILSSFFGLKVSNVFVSLILSLDRLELESNFSLLLTTSFTYLELIVVLTKCSILLSFLLLGSFKPHIPMGESGNSFPLPSIFSLS